MKTLDCLVIYYLDPKILLTDKENLNNIQITKAIISNKIEELNKSIGLHSIVSSSFDNLSVKEIKKAYKTLNDKEQKSLDEVINRIFSKK